MFAERLVEMKGARVNPLFFLPANILNMIVAFASIGGTRVYSTKQKMSPIPGLEADRNMAETEGCET